MVARDINTATPTFHVSLAAPSSDVAKVVLFVSVDGGPARFVAEFGPGAGSADFAAIVDGQSHSYLFYAVGTDRSGNVEPETQAKFEGTAVTRSFAPPRATEIVVQHGQAERSYVRYVDVIFDQPDAPGSLLNGEAIKLLRQGLKGGPAVPIAVDGLVHVTPTGLELDFGPAGIGGAPSSTAADGVYQVLLIDSPQTFTFSRLLGDANGDGAVNAADLKLVSASRGRTGTGLAADVNGDGRVDKSDRTIVSRSLGRHLPQPPRVHRKSPSKHAHRAHPTPTRLG